MHDYQHDFITHALACGVLKFGQFLLKSGRNSPYFFNTGLFDTGAKLGKLGQFYAQALLNSGIQADVLFGPAYKGIPLVSATAIAYAQLSGKDLPFAFNRKEVKDHGEGGELIGAKLQGKVVIVDDVITAGTAISEAINIIKRAQATPVAVICALDRQEQGPNGSSAVEEVSGQYGIPVLSIVSLANIVEYLSATGDLAAIAAIKDYQSRYGINIPR